MNPVTDTAGNSVQPALRALRAAAQAVGRPLTFMEICGTHTVAAFRMGLPDLLPPHIALRSGPGCPVCVTSQGDIDALIDLAQQPGVTLCTYGDMLRVPGSTHGIPGSLELARSRGADIRVIYSTLDAVQLAQTQPQREVVLAAVGFETTTPATAAAVARAASLNLPNFSVLLSHKRLLPAMHALLQAGRGNIDGFLCPGHVSVILGSDVFQIIPQRYGLPCVVAGFEPNQMAQGLAMLTEMVQRRQPAVGNVYPQAVKPRGNPHALELIARVFIPGPATWRALGDIPDSGWRLRPEYQSFDAAARFGITVRQAPEPHGCRCGEVITARCLPTDCALFRTTCTPATPVGPCMVSSEGTCQAWHRYRTTA